jgi:hypothetical protein
MTTSTMTECLDCQNLWKAYESAVFDHVRLNGKLRIAEASGDEGALEQLQAEAAEATQRRSRARQQLFEHQRAAGHGEIADLRPSIAG